MPHTLEPLHDTGILDLCPLLIQVFGNILTSDRIFFDLSISDVLQCSLANKFFGKICRFFLRLRKHLELNIDLSKHSRIVQLNEMLMNSTDLPFVGSKITFLRCFKHREQNEDFKLDLENSDLYCRHYQTHDDDLHVLFPYIFQKLPVKSLRLDFQHHSVCLCEDIFKKLLITRASSVEYLEILNWPSGGMEEAFNLWKYLNIPLHAEELTDLDQSIFFQSLRTCNFHITRRYCSASHKVVISQIIMSSPLLENIFGHFHTGDFPSSNTSSLPPNKLHVLRGAVCDSREIVDKLLGIKPKLEVFGFGLDGIQGVCYNELTEAETRDEVKKNLTAIIENCRKSLTTLVCINAVHMLSHVINIPLLKCILLELDLSHHSYQGPEFTNVLLLLQAINFQNLPNLRRVDLIFQPFHYSHYNAPDKIQVEDRPLFKKRGKFKCFSVKELSIKCRFFEHFLQTIQPWFAMEEVFPNVTSLHLDEFEYPEIVRQMGLQWNQNLEFVSCYFRETSQRPCLVLLTELLESICDITVEELSAVNRNDWSYHPTRQLLFKHNSRIALRLGHGVPCTQIFPESEADIYKCRFERISSWIRAKQPKFSLLLEFKPCELGKLCNPISFYDGKRFQQHNNWLISVPSDCRTWLLNF